MEFCLLMTDILVYVSCNLALHAITPQGLYELRVELEDWEGNKTFARYDYFKVGAYEDIYMLAVSGYSGTAGDSLGYHDGMVFDTYDIGASVLNGTEKCAELAKGGWWYSSCYHSNLNGYYHVMDGNVRWRHFRWPYPSLKRTEMKLRRT